MRNDSRSRAMSLLRARARAVASRSVRGTPAGPRDGRARARPGRRACRRRAGQRRGQNGSRGSPFSFGRSGPGASGRRLAFCRRGSIASERRVKRSDFVAASASHSARVSSKPRSASCRASRAGPLEAAQLLVRGELSENHFDALLRHGGQVSHSVAFHARATDADAQKRTKIFLEGNLGWGEGEVSRVRRLSAWC